MSPAIGYWKPTAEDIEQLRKSWHDNAWTQEGLEKLLYSRFGFAQIRQIQGMNQQEWEELTSAIASLQVREMFCTETK